MEIGDLGHLLLDPVQPFPSGVNSSGPVGHDDVSEARGKQQLYNGDGGGTGAGGDDLHVLLFLADHLQGVLQTCQGDDGGAVLIIVENGNVALFFQLPLDLKAPGGRNILQIDAAEGAGHQVDGVDKLVHILGFHTKGEGIHIAEGFEQDALALHDGHTGLRADISQAQNGGAIGDDGAEVVPPGQLVGFVDVLLDLQAGGGNAGGIGEGQVLLGFHRRHGLNFNFAPPLGMQPQGLFCVIHECSS